MSDTRNKIVDIIKPFFSQLEVEVTEDNLNHEKACFSKESIESKFFFSNVEMVDRVRFNEAIDSYKQSNPNIIEFKMMPKRVEQSVRFYIKVNIPSSN